MAVYFSELVVRAVLFPVLKLADRGQSGHCKRAAGRLDNRPFLSPCSLIQTRDLCMGRHPASCAVLDFAPLDFAPLA